MSSEGSESRQIPAPLARRLGNDARAGQIADEVVVIWEEIDAALTPILGKRGVAALYKRSLYLTASVHPWLAGMPEGVPAQLDLAALKSVFAQQGSADAAAGGNELLQRLYQLLASLVGPSLTERLLRSVWADSLSVPPPQDTTT